MPKKSIREMSAFEKRHYSLAGKTFRQVILGAFILGLVAFLVGFGLYAFIIARSFVQKAYSCASGAASVLTETTDCVSFAADVRHLYETTVRAGADGSPDGSTYRSFYKGFEERDDFRMVHTILAHFLRSDNELYDVYVAFFDAERGRIVYIADPETNPEYYCAPGFWESVSDKEIHAFLNWNGEGKPFIFESTAKYGRLATSGYPIRSENGDTVAFVLADISLNTYLRSLVLFLIQYSLILFATTLLMAVLMARHMKKKLAEPINQIALSAEEYMIDKRCNADRNDHFSSLEIRTGDEVERLYWVLSDMERDINEYDANLARITAERERVGTELALAHRIQADMLPNVFPAFPDRTDFDIYAIMRPAKEVGGDFYDFFLVDDSHLAMVMADVSGKGVPAALFMMISKILVKNHVKNGLTPGAALETLNRQICANNREEMFVTVWLGILDLNDGTLTAVNAGHEYPALKKPDGTFELIKDKHGFVIGGLDSARYQEYKLNLDPGTKLFLYTDGVPEATREGGELFGTSRMVEALRQFEDRDPTGLLNGVLDEVDLFVGASNQFDDITMLCVEYKGKDA